MQAIGGDRREIDRGDLDDPFTYQGTLIIPDKCAICFDPFKTLPLTWGEYMTAHYLDAKGDKVQFLHPTHAGCIQESFIKSKKECPSCRQQFDHTRICILDLKTTPGSHEIVDMKISSMTKSMWKKVQQNLAIGSQDLRTELRVAVQEEDEEEITAIFKQIPASDRRMFLKFALFTAIEAGSYEATKILLEYHAQNFKGNKSGLSFSFLRAVQRSNEDIVYYKHETEDLLYVAARAINPNYGKIAYLLGLYMTMGSLEGSFSKESRELYDNVFALMRGAKIGLVATVKSMLKEGRIDGNPLLPNLRSEALLVAVDSDQLEVVRLLLRDHKSEDPFKLLETAARRGRAEIFHLLFDQYGDALSYDERIDLLTSASGRPTLFIKGLRRLLQNQRFEGVGEDDLLAALSQALATRRKEILGMVMGHMICDSRCESVLLKWLDAKAEGSKLTNFEVALGSKMLSEVALASRMISENEEKERLLEESKR